MNFDPASAAQWLGVSKTTIRLMPRDGRLPFSRVGRRIIIQLDDLRALLATTRVPDGSPRERQLGHFPPTVVEPGFPLAGTAGPLFSQRDHADAPVPRLDGGGGKRAGTPRRADRASGSGLADDE
jgi:excisionase family DNA binding protein